MQVALDWRSLQQSTRLRTTVKIYVTKAKDQIILECNFEHWIGAIYTEMDLNENALQRP